MIKSYKILRNPDDPLNTFLNRAVISKLTGNALFLVDSHPEIRDWNELNNLLGLTFEYQRNLDSLLQEILIMKPYKNESYILDNIFKSAGASLLQN